MHAPHVVIVGGGFGGLYAAFALDRQPVRVTLVDKQNYHLFQPLLYQVATAGLSPRDIAQPIRHILSRSANIRVLLAFEEAEREPEPARRRALVTFVVVGGGPTGVELAGALAEIAKHALARDFRVIDPTQARIILLEAGPRVLAPFAEPLSRAAEHCLRSRGVEVRTSAAVTRITPGLVEVGEDRLSARTVLWAAGVEASPIAQTLGVSLDKAGRVLVEPDLTVPGYPRVFVIGDLAAFIHQGERPLPGLAPVAMQMGRHAATNILRAVRGEYLLPFRYRDRGMMATIGRNAAVAEIGPIRVNGIFAWLLWVVVHISFLIGFRNRMLVLLEWMWAYFTYNRGVRLITDPSPRQGTAQKGSVPPDGLA